MVAVEETVAWERLGLGRDELRARDRGERDDLCFDPLGVLRGGPCQRGGSKPDTCQLKQSQTHSDAASEQSRNLRWLEVKIRPTK
jgi:hypothetical protein